MTNFYKVDVSRDFEAVIGKMMEDLEEGHLRTVAAWGKDPDDPEALRKSLWLHLAILYYKAGVKPY
jgi:hypothetical protein